MIRHAAVLVIVLAALAAGPRARASQSDELKQIKADIKLALAQAKTDTDAAVSVFAADLNILQLQIQNNSIALSNVASTLTDSALTAAHDIIEANRDASNTVSAQVIVQATVTLANATLPGGGGDFDKFRTSQDALMAKALKKMQGLVKKFQKGASSASSSPFAVNVVLLPFPPAQSVYTDHIGGPSSNTVPNNSIAVMVGASSGQAAIGGIAFGGTVIHTEVDLASALDIATPSPQKWKRVATGTPGTTVTFSVTDAAFEAIQGFVSIGVPTAP